MSFVPIGIAVITISDTRTEATDTSGAVIRDRMLALGHRICAVDIVHDDLDTIRQTFASHIENSDVDAIIATGGTGITARDVTPDALAPLVTKAIPGFGELFRWLSYKQIGSSTVQSRAMAALCGQTLVFLLPGSTRAVELAMDEILVAQLDSRHKPCNFVELLPRIRA